MHGTVAAASRRCSAISPTILVSTLLAAATLLDPLGALVLRMHPGLEPATPGAHCAASYTTLGTNVGGGSPKRTTVVNVWFVRYRNEPMGWIVKTAGGTYWYESPDSSYYEQITAANANELMQAGIAIGGCFRGDLAP